MRDLGPAERERERREGEGEEERREGEEGGERRSVCVNCFKAWIKMKAILPKSNYTLQGIISAGLFELKHI